MALAAVSPERREARSALARALAAGVGGGAGERAAGFPWRETEGSALDARSVGRRVVPGGPWIWQSVTQLSNFWSSGVEAGASGPASLSGGPDYRPRAAPAGRDLSQPCGEGALGVSLRVWLQSPGVRRKAVPRKGEKQSCGILGLVVRAAVGLGARG